MKVEKLYLKEAASNETSNWLFNQLQGIKSGNGNGLKLSREEARAIVNKFKEDNRTENNQNLIRQRAEEIVAQQQESSHLSQRQGEINNDTLLDIEKGFYKEPNAAKIRLRTYLQKNLNMPVAAEHLDNFRPEFIATFLDSLGIENLNNTEPFIKILNHKNGDIIFKDGDEDIFSNCYNGVRDVDNNISNDYINDPNSIVWYKNLYEKVPDSNKVGRLIELDMDRGNEIRNDLKTSIDNTSYGKFINTKYNSKGHAKGTADAAMDDVRNLSKNKLADFDRNYQIYKQQIKNGEVNFK